MSVYRNECPLPNFSAARPSMDERRVQLEAVYPDNSAMVALLLRQYVADQVDGREYAVVRCERESEWTQTEETV